MMMGSTTTIHANEMVVVHMMGRAHWVTPRVACIEKKKDFK